MQQEHSGERPRRLKKTKEMRACPRKRRRKKKEPKVGVEEQQNLLLSYAQMNLQSQGHVAALGPIKQQMQAEYQFWEEEEKRERLISQEWVTNLIQDEQAAVQQQFFLENTKNSVFFSEMMSTFNTDYELVCPYYHAGCRVSCLRSRLAKHLADECKFCVDISLNPLSASRNPMASQDATQAKETTNDYEIVCPYSIIGCKHTCQLS